MTGYKEIYHTLLLGDYIEFKQPNDHSICRGYVYELEFGNFGPMGKVIDLDNYQLFNIPSGYLIDDESDRSKAKVDFSNSIISVKRNIQWNSEYICNNYCTLLKQLPDSCDVCPLGKVCSNSVHFIGDVIRISKRDTIIRKVSFVRQSFNTFAEVFSCICGFFPKPRNQFKDLSIEGLKDIFENPQYYDDLTSRIYYFISGSSYYFENFELSNHRGLQSKGVFDISSRLGNPCSMCFLNSNCDNGCDCKLKTLKLL